MDSFNFLKFEIEFNRDAKAALAKGESWSGKLNVIIKGDSRAREVQKQKKEAKVRATRSLAKKVQLTPDELTLIEYWNTSDVVQNKSDDWQQRNVPVVLPIEKKELWILRKVLSFFSLEQLRKYLDAYFARCDKGDHFQRNRNVAYKDLFGFLRKVDSIKNRRDSAWWMPADIDPAEVAKIRDTPEAKVIVAIANAYAKKFLGLQVYPTSIKARDYDALKRASLAVAAAIKQFPIDTVKAIDLLLDCAKDSFPGTIYLAHLGGAKFLYNTLIQYLKGIYG